MRQKNANTTKNLLEVQLARGEAKKRNFRPVEVAGLIFAWDIKRSNLKWHVRQFEAIAYGDIWTKAQKKVIQEYVQRGSI